MVDVIIPMFNSEKTIQMCLDSLVKQIYSDFKIILVNDGSTDQSACFVKMHALYLSNRIILVEQENAGVSAARNTGLKTSRAEYVVFVDSDDCIKPNHLSVLFEAIDKNQTDIAVSNYERVENSKAIESNIISDKYQYDLIYSTKSVFPDFFNHTITITIWNTIFRRKKILQFFDLSIKRGEDLNFLYQFILNDYKIVFVKQVTYTFFYESKKEFNRYNKNPDDLIKIYQDPKIYSQIVMNNQSIYVENIIKEYLVILCVFHATKDRVKFREYWKNFKIFYATNKTQISSLKLKLISKVLICFHWLLKGILLNKLKNKIFGRDVK